MHKSYVSVLILLWVFVKRLHLSTDGWDIIHLLDTEGYGCLRWVVFVDHREQATVQNILFLALLWGLCIIQAEIWN